MEINITWFFREACPRNYSASVAEIGANAGADTWRAAVADSSDYMILDTDEKREAFRAFVKSSGGWNAEEIAAWNDTELNALCLQWIAGDIRESMYLENSPIDWAAYEKDENERHSIFRGIDGEIYFCIEG
jgi:hypothetical protein